MTDFSRMSIVARLNLTEPIDICVAPIQLTRTGASPVCSSFFLHLDSDRSTHLTDRLLMPVFGTGAIRDMFPAMEDIVSQLVTKWERFATFVQRWKPYTKVLVGLVLTISSIPARTTPS